jgi:hypothetical protein
VLVLSSAVSLAMILNKLPQASKTGAGGQRALITTRLNLLVGGKRSGRMIIFVFRSMFQIHQQFIYSANTLSRAAP